MESAEDESWRIDALCAEKLHLEEDIFALVIASLPQDLLDRILKDEEMIAKDWEETNCS